MCTLEDPVAEVAKPQRAGMVRGRASEVPETFSQTIWSPSSNRARSHSGIGPRGSPWHSTPIPAQHPLPASTPSPGHSLLFPGDLQSPRLLVRSSESHKTASVPQTDQKFTRTASQAGTGSAYGRHERMASVHTVTDSQDRVSRPGLSPNGSAVLQSVHGSMTGPRKAQTSSQDRRRLSDGQRTRSGYNGDEEYTRVAPEVDRASQVDQWRRKVASQSSSSDMRIPVTTDAPDERKQHYVVYDPHYGKLFNGWGRPLTSTKVGPRRTQTRYHTAEPEQDLDQISLLQMPEGGHLETQPESEHDGEFGSAESAQTPHGDQTPRRSASPKEADNRKEAASFSAQAPEEGVRAARKEKEDKHHRSHSHKPKPMRDVPDGKDNRKHQGRIERRDLVLPKPQDPLPQRARKERAVSAPPPGGLLSRRLGKKQQRQLEESSDEPEDDSSSSSSSSSSDTEDSPDDSSDGSSSTSSSSSSSSSTSSDDDPENPDHSRRRKEKQRKKRKARKREKRLHMLRDLKIPMPSYNGADDYDAFEAFIGKWDSYARSHGLKGTDAIDVIQHALKGKASIWVERREQERRRMERRRATLSRSTRPAPGSKPWGSRGDSARETAAEGQRRSTAGSTPTATVAASRPTGAKSMTDCVSREIRTLPVGVKLTRKQMAEHREQKLCYHCHKAGHDSSQCRTKNRVGGSSVRAAAVAPSEETPSIQQSTGPLKPRVKRRLQALPSAAVSVMSASFPRNVLTSFAHIAVHIAAPEAHSLEVRRDQLQLALADYFSPLTPRRNGIQPSGRRFHIITAGDPDAVDVMPEYFVVYDEVREAELVFPITSFGPLGVDVGRAVAAHLGVTERDLGRILRLGGRSPPLVERIYGALTQIGNVWAVVRTIHDLVECGGDETDRWLLQTNGAEIWLRDQLYGTCYELSTADLTSGITLAEALRRPELGDRPGVLLHSGQFPRLAGALGA
ncbi:hypothetical protein AURDEDRAFT_123095 [Auricularia subglabra TFB-10046 SS5]|nr:hypothetical protein AURDEDRAFT_123095 [Auricularia subglabra TFB-10046 SS5]